MIPKVINYCWFGGSELPEKVKKCIESWKKYCPNYQIKRWDEENYNIEESCEFVKNAYKQKKWAFVSDYVRLEVIYNNGGVYLDTDVELLKSLDDLLLIDGKGFWGFEKENQIASGLGFAAPKNEEIILEMMLFYHKLEFDINKLTDIACPKINTNIFLRHGLMANNTYQEIGRYRIYPTEYLCPINIFTGQINITEKTVSIHHYNASWMVGLELIKLRAIILIKRILPSKIVEYIRTNIRKRKNRGIR